MDNTLDLSELTLHKSGKMSHYEENEFQEPELLFEASTNETEETSETDESLRSDNAFDSDHSLESDESLDMDEELEVVDKVNQVTSVSVDGEHEQDDEDLQEQQDAFHHAQVEKLDQEEGIEMETSASDDIKVPRKKSKWLAQWFRQQEELY